MPVRKKKPARPHGAAAVAKPTSQSPKSQSGGTGSEWDAVAEASWESFPASDPPAWISRRPAQSAQPVRRREPKSRRGR